MKAVVFGLIGAVLAGPAHAAFTNVDLSGAVNSNVAINPGTFPVGVTTGNEGTTIPFAISPYPSGSGVAGTWNAEYSAAGVLDVALTSLGITGQNSFYALLNNYYGTPGADEYDITVKATNGDSVTFKSIGGVDTRDYNAAVFSNTIAASTTPWFNNGIGQRLDVREFTLPASFATETLSDFIITQVRPGDPALFSGLTFSTAAASFGVPAPGSSALAVAGVLLLAAARRRAA